MLVQGIKIAHDAICDAPTSGGEIHKWLLSPIHMVNDLYKSISAWEEKRDRGIRKSQIVDEVGRPREDDFEVDDGYQTV